MGAIWMPVISYASSLTELVGSRAGLAIDRDELHKMLEEMPGYDGFILEDDDVVVRIRSEVIEEIVSHLMYKVGILDEPADMYFHIRLYHKYKNDDDKTLVLQDIALPFIKAISKGGDIAHAKGSNQIDPEPIMRMAHEKHGKLGLDVVVDLMEGYNRSLVVNPWTRIRSAEWSSTVQLKELFDSESLETQYGAFLDQRFIDYLSNNQDAIGDIHWRKFEGLAAEFFERAGYKVDIGPGRNDDGVDIRVWPEKDDPSNSPLILVQCKRQKAKIDKVVVKSLYADILHEKADGGLVVTSSRLSPGAENSCKARKYPIDQINRESLSKWIQQMRTPGTGIFLGE